MEEELAFASRGVVVDVACGVGRDVALMQGGAAFVYAGKGVAQAHTVLTDGFDFRAREADARFDSVEDGEVVAGGGVGGDSRRLMGFAGHGRGIFMRGSGGCVTGAFRAAWVRLRVPRLQS